MNTFWLKIAGVALALFVVLIVVARFFSSDSSTPRSEPREEPEVKDIYEQAQVDQERFSVPTAESPVPEPVAAEPEPAPDAPPSAATVPEAPPAPKPTVIYVKPLDEIDSIQAEKLLNAAIPGRTMARMSVGYNLTVQNCKQIIRDFPGTVYAFQAKQILASIPERFRERYHLTEQLLDASEFLQRRPGTQPMQIAVEN